MKKQEIILFRALCNFKTGKVREKMLTYANPNVLGYLFFNRMQAIAYGTLKEKGLLGKVGREFRNSLKGAYEQNIVKNESFFSCVRYLNYILSNCTCKYAMLKGAFLCRQYPAGYRVSNDIDLLVLPEHVTEIGKVLTDAGFLQGNIRNGEFVQASRKEIIESKMMRGETVPYIKEINLPGMKYLEVDINFSLDYKNSKTDTLAAMLWNAQSRKIGELEIQTLEPSDFFLHLCVHLYKEATTLPWVEMRRDMTLYKYCDIYMLLADMTDKETMALFRRAGELELEKICSFAVLQTAALFDVANETAIGLAADILRDDKDFLHTVISPKEKTSYVYREKDVLKRFFCEKRKALLEEVKSDAEITDETK